VRASHDPPNTLAKVGVLRGIVKLANHKHSDWLALQFDSIKHGANLQICHKKLEALGRDAEQRFRKDTKQGLLFQLAAMTSALNNIVAVMQKSLDQHLAMQPDAGPPNAGDSITDFEEAVFDVMAPEAFLDFMETDLYQDSVNYASTQWTCKMSEGVTELVTHSKAFGHVDTSWKKCLGDDATIAAVLSQAVATLGLVKGSVLKALLEKMSKDRVFS
jgi:DNA-binding FrmR family transcriptional regulator